jgi:nucleoside-diphosphate-sugar epimerase
VVTSICACLFSKNSHGYSYNVSGPDFPSYEQILNLISSQFLKLNVTFSSSNKINERKNFSTKKIKNDINWEPKFTIQKGLQDYFNNISNK